LTALANSQNDKRHTLQTAPKNEIFIYGQLQNLSTGGIAVDALMISIGKLLAGATVAKIIGLRHCWN